MLMIIWSSVSKWWKPANALADLPCVGTVSAVVAYVQCGDCCGSSFGCGWFQKPLVMWLRLKSLVVWLSLKHSRLEKTADAAISMPLSSGSKKRWWLGDIFRHRIVESSPCGKERMSLILHSYGILIRLSQVGSLKTCTRVILLNVSWREWYRWMDSK